MVIFPLTFVANTFVPSDDLPGPLRDLRRVEPGLVGHPGRRELFGNIPAGTAAPEAWPLRHPVLYTMIWVVVTIAVFAPLSVHRYRRATRH